MASTTPDLQILDNPKRIRGVRNGETIVDSTAVRFVWEHRYYPAWYIPVADIRAELRPNGETFASDNRGEGERLDLVHGGETITDAAWRHPNATDGALRSLVRFEWDSMDAWFEEDVEVFVHPRSPHIRVDALPSSRPIRVLIDGVVVAESNRSTMLFETGLPTRYYLPKTDVRMDLLTPTAAETACPYKGWASYWSVTIDGVVHDDVAWGYRTPLPESQAIAGLVCFYNERVTIQVG